MNVFYEYISMGFFFGQWLVMPFFWYQIWKDTNDLKQEKETFKDKLVQSEKYNENLKGELMQTLSLFKDKYEAFYDVMKDCQHCEKQQYNSSTSDFYDPLFYKHDVGKSILEMEAVRHTILNGLK